MPVRADPTMGGADLSRAILDLASVDGPVPINNDLRTGQGIELIIHRASIGVGTPDPAFPNQFSDIIKHRFMAGAYHVLFPSHSGTDQAKEFVRTVRGTCHVGDKALLVVDWESVCWRWANSKNKKVCTLRGPVPPEMTADFVSEVRAETKKSPVIYTDHNTLNLFGKSVSDSTLHSPLWYAMYQAKYLHAGHWFQGYIIPNRDDVAPWKDWAMWQFGEGKGLNVTTHVSVLVGKRGLDLSFFNGNRAQLSSFFDQNAWQCDGKT
jgi:GH25 family lysozyme M1 (1,4-beta-N-acetylmuramidase)